MVIKSLLKILWRKPQRATQKLAKARATNGSVSPQHGTRFTASTCSWKVGAFGNHTLILSCWKSLVQTEDGQALRLSDMETMYIICKIPNPMFSLCFSIYFCVLSTSHNYLALFFQTDFFQDFSVWTCLSFALNYRWNFMLRISRVTGRGIEFL